MKGKQLLIAVIVLGVLGGIAYFTSTHDQGSQAKIGVGKTVVTDLDPSKIATIAITDNDATLTLAQKDEKWTVTERDGFAAKFDALSKGAIRDLTLTETKIYGTKAQGDHKDDTALIAVFTKI